MRVNRVLSILLLLTLVFSTFAPALSTRVSAQEVDPAVEKAQAMLERMRPDERVGQLFLVTFQGTAADAESQIYELISRYHVGGVILSGANDNIADMPDTVSATYDLIAQLQNIEWQASQTPDIDPVTRDYLYDEYIPLFVGISQIGDSFPENQILAGLSPQSSQMAFGATWQPKLAEQSGFILGQELSAIGFNLFFGPSLDILESPESLQGTTLGSSVFGGDPYWVAEMGRAYIGGLHDGSDGRMVVVATHFPGRGSADRPAGEEPATVRKSLEALKQFDLAPFFAVTGNALTPATTADGLLVSHIRYQGFQGNIRSTTRPVSFDPQALSQIMSLPEFATWRGNGGLMISDDLGSQTVRTFYDPGGTAFSARLVARDAFLAGNDLLNLGDIVSSDAPDNYTTMVRALEFFAQKYQEDSTFALRVDEAVVRILAAKYRIYTDFSTRDVIPPETNLELVGYSTEATLAVANDSATLISPDPIDLDAAIPSPPNVYDRIVFLTDVRLQRQCSTCLETPILAVDAMENAILRLYGPQGGGQVSPNRMNSYAFSDLSSILDGNSGTSFEGNIRSADWIIISMLDSDPGQSGLTLLRRFLSERQDILRDKYIVAFAFGAPYYLDATDISKLTAYYGLYSKSPPFVDVAARLLFQELSPRGSLPVSVTGIGYDLFSATFPDPLQVIQLTTDPPPAPAATAAPGMTESVPTPAYRIGDTITVQTGIILDHNQHQVPDGTGVHFVLSMGGDGGVIQQIDSQTVQGVARASFNIDQSGLLEIRATSDPATTSVVLRLDVSGDGVNVTVVAPTPSPDNNTPTPELTPTPVGEDEFPFADGSPGFSGWFVMVVCLAGIAALIYWMGARTASALWGLRWAACAVLGGLLAYNYLALRLPGGADWVTNREWGGILGVVLLGAALGCLGGWIWWRVLSGSGKRSG